VLGLSTVPPAAGSPAADRRGHKHSHGTIQVYRQAAVFAAPGSVGSGFVLCPQNTAATGGGSDYVAGIATVQMGFEGNGYYVLLDNFDSSISSQVNVQVACTAGTTKAKARQVPRGAVEDAVDGMAATLEAAHHAAG
jgi:hypothetical protein